MTGYYIRAVDSDFEFGSVDDADDYQPMGRRATFSEAKAELETQTGQAFHVSARRPPPPPEQWLRWTGNTLVRR